LDLTSGLEHFSNLVKLKFTVVPKVEPARGSRGWSVVDFYDSKSVVKQVEQLSSPILVVLQVGLATHRLAGGPGYVMLGS
jgi:hypothetical protein